MDDCQLRMTVTAAPYAPTSDGHACRVTGGHCLPNSSCQDWQTKFKIQPRASTYFCQKCNASAVMTTYEYVGSKPCQCGTNDWDIMPLNVDISASDVEDSLDHFNQYVAGDR